MVGVEDGGERMGDGVDQKTFMKLSNNKKLFKKAFMFGYVVHR